ncbi:MAG: hypothetical protein JWM68_2275 [Verrucomicrobiales bacterium]|nr:hypothetical protein [Verrucomicrobiales bacterium]
MNENKSSNPVTSDISSISERVASAVRAQKRTMGILTGAAFSFGFATIIASVIIVAGYFLLYQPKQNHLLKLAKEAAQAQSAGTRYIPPANENSSRGEPKPVDIPFLILTNTHALGIGIMLVAAAVGLLALGTVVTLTLVVVQRRATLNQINLSLAQISSQLKELQPPNSLLKK